MTEESPQYPLTVHFADGEEVTVGSAEEAERELEWLDTEDPEEEIVVTDNRGRLVSLKVEGLRLLRCELAPGR